MTDFELKIEDTSEHVKRFSVTRKSKTSPFSISSIILSSILTFLLSYYLDKNTYQSYSDWNPTIRYLIIFAAFPFFFLLTRGNPLVKESLIVLKDIGIQIEKKYLSGKKDIEFVDISKLKDIIIHEGMTPFDVRYYMGIIIKGSSNLMIPFKEFNLKLDQMKQIFLSSRPLIKSI